MIADTVTGLRQAQAGLELSDMGMCGIVGVTLDVWRDWRSYKSPRMPGDEAVRRIEMAEELKRMKEERCKSN